MKNILIILLSIVFVSSMLFVGIGCKEEAAPAEETTEEVTEDVTEEETEEAVEEVEETVELKVPENKTISLLTCSDWWTEKDSLLLEKYAEEAGLNLEIELIPGGADFWNIVETRFITGEVPDLINTGVDTASIRVLNHKENLLTLENEAWAKNIKEASMNSLLRGGVLDYLYILPFSTQSLYGYFYNKKVFEDAGVSIPKSMTDMAEVTFPKLKEAGYTPEYIMGKDLWAIGCEMIMYIADQIVTDQELVNKINTNQIGFEETDVVKYIEWLQDIIEKEYVNEDWLVGTYNDACRALAEGKVGVSPLVNICYGMFSEEELEYIGEFSASKDTNRGTVNPPMGFGIPKVAKNVEGALYFGNYLTQEHILNDFYKETSYVNVWSSVSDDYMDSLSREYFETNGDLEIGPYLNTLVVDIGWFAPEIMVALMGEKTAEEAAIAITKIFQENAKAAGIAEFQ